MNLATPHPTQVRQARHYILTGIVQGVGFRPFVYQLAAQYNIYGWTANGLGHVAIHAEGNGDQLQAFHHGLTQQAPKAARPIVSESKVVAADYFNTFTIRDSYQVESGIINVLPDLPICDACLAELNEMNNRRFRYAFINCTHCGPRYTMIRNLPYDRRNTSMDDFPLCEACQQEYNNPASRRFHAEVIACPNCGPKLFYKQNYRQKSYQRKNYRQQTQLAPHHSQAALKAAISDLIQGKIIAVKGVGGYHLMCAATNDQAVKCLRQRKQRPHKPLAVMILPKQLDDYVVNNPTERNTLESQVRPIVLLKQRNDQPLSRYLAPGLSDIGVLLPYSPLHYLLLQSINTPLVATSANISGEPVITNEVDIESRLHRVCDGYLHHDRPILHPADDAVFQIINNQPHPLRLGRGNTPLELTLPFSLPYPLIATGAHMKNTVALAWGERIVISPHVGDLNSPRSLRQFEQTIKTLQQLYQVNAQQVVCDAHPGYLSSQWAETSALALHHVQHHYAHASCLSGEYTKENTWLVFAWDGIGLGPDQTAWGGETLYGNSGHWQRLGSMRTFKLAGGDGSSRQPWRSAAALCWELDLPCPALVPEFELAFQGWRKNINCITSSSVGRLFDAAAALLNIAQTTSYEAQAPMLLENIARNINVKAVRLPLKKDNNNIWRTDWSVLLEMLLNKKLSVAERANCFHQSLAQALLDQALKFRESHGDFAVGLCGGVFQNRLLTELVIDLLKQHDFRYYLPRKIPLNDAGICYGQVIEAYHTRPHKHLP